MEVLEERGCGGCIVEDIFGILSNRMMRKLRVIEVMDGVGVRIFEG